MTWTIALAVTALVIASVALIVARRAARQSAHLTEMYWQLKYDHGEMKAKVFPPEPVPPPAPSGFVPLGEVKRKGQG